LKAWLGLAWLGYGLGCASYGILCCCFALALQQAERCNAARLVLVAPEEWEKGLVRVKDLGSREERDVPLDQL